MTLTAQSAAAMIDHTILAPEATIGDIKRVCEEAVAFGFYAVCVNPRFVRDTVRMVAALAPDGSGCHRPVVGTVAGFPLGANAIEIKVEEAARAMDEGAGEIDMVISVGALRAGDRKAVRSEIEAVAHVVHRKPNALLKVILETSALTDEQIILGCRCSAEGEADFVKTSTGFHASGGATVEHVRLLRRYASPIRVKASGGIRTPEAVAAMLEAGASRIGTSSGVAIVEALRQRENE